MAAAIGTGVGLGFVAGEAALTLVALVVGLATPAIGAYAGPMGFALGLLAGWVTVAIAYGLDRLG